MLLNKGVVDEQLILSSLGVQIDVARLIDHVNANEVRFMVCEYPTQKLMDLNRADRINPNVLALMDDKRIDEPALIANIYGYEWIIDGNHRLLKRHQLQKETSYYIPIKGSELDPFVSLL
jgi:hypothetical protein